MVNFSPPAEKPCLELATLTLSKNHLPAKQEWRKQCTAASSPLYPYLLHLYYVHSG
jgi:hypothetical protein